MDKIKDNTSQPQVATLGRRLLAILYDGLIIFFITVLLTILVQQLLINLNIVSLETIKEGEQEIKIIPANSIASIVLKSFWTFVSFFYFAYYWTKRGQTPGMKVWKIKVITHMGELMNWRSALYRYIFALFGMGIIWIIIDKEKLALQDRMSNTHLIKTD